jgi:hypothetical protein
MHLSRVLNDPKYSRGNGDPRGGKEGYEFVEARTSV